MNRPRTKSALALMGMAGALCALWLGLVARRRGSEWRPAVLSRHSQQVFDEVMAVENLSRPPVPSAGGSALACIRGSEQGRSLFLVDPKTLRRGEVPVTNDVRRIAGWSADGRYLAFEQKPPYSENILTKKGSRPLAEDVNESWLTLFDSRSNTVWRLTNNRKVNEKWFVWLTPRTCLFSVDSDDTSVRANYWADIETRTKVRVSDSLHDFVRMADDKAAYVKEKNIWTFELRHSDAPRTAKVSDFKAGEFDGLRWLRYNPENGCFLFCARPTNSSWRYLFKYDPLQRKLTQLSEEDTYNGQWLQPGSGFAYVGNTNNRFFLAIRPAPPLLPTNLFTAGSVANYVVADNGEGLVATASLGLEPQGIWEYHVPSGALRELVPGMAARSNAVCRWIEPEESRVKSFDGLEVPYFLFSPAELVRSTAGQPTNPVTRAGKKYPGIMYLPPQSSQFQRCFEARSQMMANLNFFFVAVNYRGCDGYGKAYSDLDDAAGAARDCLAVLTQVSKVEWVDRRNVFLWTSSSGSGAAYELLAIAPESWRGAVLVSPAGWHEDPRFEPAKFPALLFTTGDQDGALPALRQFKSWTSANGIEAKFLIYPDSGHITHNTRQVTANRKLALQFFLDHVWE